MAHKYEGWLNQVGLNLIRIVIGSYGWAIGLGYVEAADYGVLFTSLRPDWATEIGMGCLVALSTLFMAGIWLRISALLLASFVFCTNLIDMLIAPTPQAVTAFWQTLTWVAGILMCYAPLRRYEIRQATIWPFRVLSASLHLKPKMVRPRRVTLSMTGSPKGAPRSDTRTRRPVIAPTDQMIGLNRKTIPQPPKCRDSLSSEAIQDPLGWDDGDPKNLFINI